MKRKVIQIDDEKCNGCGICVDACHEGAIGLVDGKARLLRDDYCDGLGDCLPECPTGAITFIEREAAEYDAQAVAQHKASAQAADKPAAGQVDFDAPLPCGCPGSSARSVVHTEPVAEPVATPGVPSELREWPVQIKLVSPHASCFNGADLLIAADCTAYAYGNFHHDFMRGKVVIIGCPKLDDVDYSEKLTAIIRDNDIKSVTS